MGVWVFREPPACPLAWSRSEAIWEARRTVCFVYNSLSLRTENLSMLVQVLLPGLCRLPLLPQFLKHMTGLPDVPLPLDFLGCGFWYWLPFLCFKSLYLIAHGILITSLCEWLHSSYPWDTLSSLVINWARCDEPPQADICHAQHQVLFEETGEVVLINVFVPTSRDWEGELCC